MNKRKQEIVALKLANKEYSDIYYMMKNISIWKNHF